MPFNTSKFANLREAVNRCARTRLKTAAPGGSPEQPFEQAFSNIASAYINEKAPSLLDYQVGFQLLEKNEEDSKAVGVFGFKVGPQWLYAPVFFLSGDLKGHELLYIKNQDMFVPMKENWLNYLLNRKPNVLGTPTDKNMRSIGVQQPNLTQLSRSPSKYASANMPGWVQEALPALAYAASINPGKDPRYQSITDLPTFLKKEGKAVIRSLVLSFQETPALAKAFQDFHGFEIIDEAIKEANLREKRANSSSVMADAECVNTPTGVKCKTKDVKPKSVLDVESTEINVEPGDPIKSAKDGEPLGKGITFALERKLQVFTYDNVLEHGTALEDLDDKERSKLLKDKVVIRDNRDDNDVLTAYEVQSPVRLQNPTESGLYDVLVKPGKFEKCVIINGPYSERGTQGFCTLVKLEGENDNHSWINTHPTNVWVGHQYSREDYLDWWNKLDDVKGLSTDKDALQIIIGINANGTVPFTVRSESANGDRKVYDVWFKSYAERSRSGHLPRIHDEDRDVCILSRDGERLIITGKVGAKLRATGSDLMVPAGFKHLTLTAGKDHDGLFSCCDDGQSDPAPIELANQLDIDLLIGTKTASVKIYDTGSEIDINGKRMQKLAALIHLVRDWKLREKSARLLLKRAQENKVARFRVKKADQYYDLQRSAPSAPYMPQEQTGYDPLTQGQYPTSNIAEWNMVVPDMSATKTPPEIYRPTNPSKSMGVGGSMAPDHNAQQAALDAASTGQKEIFDTAMIGSLLRSVRDDSMVDRYMDDLMGGLDRLGRILFLFYWHNEKFSDRYGKDEMVELEDGLRNAFEYLGDITLFLKQRSIEADNGTDGDINLSSISD